MPLLTGLTADGTEVPVQVEPDGVLVAEGIQGPPGPQGPEGPQGPQGPKGDPGDPGTLPFGTYAWGSVSGSNGALIAGNNCTTSRTGAGNYSVVFNTPLPNANYAAVAESGYSNNVITTCTISGKTGNGFNVFTNNKDDVSTSSDFDFTVTAAFS